MNARPKIVPKLTQADRLFEAAGWVVLLLLWCFSIVKYAKLPDTIPIHFNAEGEADGFGANSGILVLPMIATALFIGLTYLNKFPHIFNYTKRITIENAMEQYSIATRMIRYLKLSIVVIFGFITFKTIQVANGQSEGLGVWFLPLMLIIMSLPTIFFISKMMTAK